MSEDKLTGAHAAIPQRFHRPPLAHFVIYLAAASFLIWAAGRVGFSPSEFVEGIPHMGRLLGEMLPPDFSRVVPLARSLLETFQIAAVGTVIGIVSGFLLAVPASRNLSPNTAVYLLARNFIAFCRTVPDLVWAIFFVVTVGLGAFAGTLTIIMDTIGFCGRFFAESMEEVETSPQQTLATIGAGKSAVLFCAVTPAAMPAFTNTALFSFERSIRSSVILGLVGAGGIGIELKAAMDLFLFSQAATVLLMILALVMVVERCNVWIRRRYLD